MWFGMEWVGSEELVVTRYVGGWVSMYKLWQV